MLRIVVKKDVIRGSVLFPRNPLSERDPRSSGSPLKIQGKSQRVFELAELPPRKAYQACVQDGQSAETRTTGSSFSKIKCWTDCSEIRWRTASRDLRSACATAP